METQTLKQFVSALEEENLDDLRAASSKSFKDKALRLDESAEDLKRLRIPTEDLKVVEVEDESETSKLVNVKIGDATKTIVYRMVKEEGSRKWVVDDIIQKKRHDGNLKVAKKVTEQMDLYLSVREFMQKWSRKNREEIEAQMTVEFAGVMHELPNDYFDHLYEKVGDVESALERFRPEATLNEDTAVVRISRKKGRLDIGMKLVDDRWLVRDMAVESSRDTEYISSMIKSADALRSVAIFLKGYSAADKTTIKEVSEPNFYKNAIMPGELAAVSLPAAESLNNDSRMTIRGDRIDVNIPFNGEIASLTLKSIDRPEGQWKQHGYHVTDVSLIRSGATGENRKLSALLTSKARVDIFHEALVKRDLKTLTYSSSYDFNTRVWKNVDEEILAQLPIDLPKQGKFEIEDIVFNGSVTQVYTLFDEIPITYILREHSGELRIDDVQFPMAGKPNSVKTLLEVVIPAYQFAQTASKSSPTEEIASPKSLKDVQKLGQHYNQIISRMSNVCSFDFNYFVWKETDVVPEPFFNCSEHLETAITSVQPLNANGTEQMIQFGDEHWGAQVKVIQQQGSFRVDDVKLVAGKDVGYDLKIAARDQLNEKGRSLRSIYPLLHLQEGEAMAIETQLAKDFDNQNIEGGNVISSEKGGVVEEYQFSENTPSMNQAPAGNPFKEFAPAQPQSNPIQQVAGWDDFNHQSEKQPASSGIQNSLHEEDVFPDYVPPNKSTSPTTDAGNTRTADSTAAEFPEEFPPLETYPGN
ncbi:hypothetical protein Pla110_31610 [Polystyrenella longa]|uniref:Uncharacterized protein n=2 Tax=Polystyrenella longa TaxID=2528007 RepID=A0A518CQE1_9PLAN|nr:hypothetical protein Pla110_31610 [Polystyrenella longa]